MRILGLFIISMRILINVCLPGNAGKTHPGTQRYIITAVGLLLILRIYPAQRLINAKA